MEDRHNKGWQAMGSHEMQFVVRKEKIEHFKTIASLTFELTRKHFNFRCPLAGEMKIGSNWSETH